LSSPLSIYKSAIAKLSILSLSTVKRFFHWTNSLFYHWWP